MREVPGEVVTQRLVLRAWRLDDVAALGAAIGESLEHLRPWMDWIALEPQSDADRAALISSWAGDRASGGDAIYGVFRHGVVVGGAGLHRRSGRDTLEIGYWVHVDHLRRGYARELSEGLTNAAFQVEGIERVEIHHDVANVRSAAVARSLGYRLGEGRPDESAAALAPGKIGIDREWFLTRSDLPAGWSGGDASESAPTR